MPKAGFALPKDHLKKVVVLTLNAQENFPGSTQLFLFNFLILRPVLSIFFKGVTVMAKNKRSYFEIFFPIGADMEGNAEPLVNGTVCPQKATNFRLL
jgi:hypothetical protein